MHLCRPPANVTARRDHHCTSQTDMGDGMSSMIERSHSEEKVVYLARGLMRNPKISLRLCEWLAAGCGSGAVTVAAKHDAAIR